METPDLRRKSSETSSGRRAISSTIVRARRERNSSNTSSTKRPRTPDDQQSLTSFPSLSPSLETSPHGTLPPPFSQHVPRPADGRHNASARQPSTALENLFLDDEGQSERSSLFGDGHRDTKALPGTVHHQTDEQIQHMLVKVGPVKLVRRMAEDVARRDAQVTLMQRKAEERERLLRKMLRECEVSNMEIERRLKELEHTEDIRQRKPPSLGAKGRNESSRRSSAVGYGMHERLAEAFEDPLTISTVVQSSRSPSMNSAEGDFVDVETDSRQVDASSTAPRSWRSIFKYNNTANGGQSNTIAAPRTSSNGTTARTPRYDHKTLSSDVFRPPPLAKRSSSAMESLKADLTKDRQRAAESSTHKSSGSVTSWAFKLVTGRSANTSEEAPAVAHGRSVTLGSGSTKPLIHGDRLSQPKNRDVSAKSRDSRTRTSIGPNGTIKGVPVDIANNQMPGMQPTNSPDRVTVDRDENPGPVEMDTILPDDVRPPTLAPQINGLSAEAAGLLTDRFGFIYDQRRRRRQNDALAASANGRDRARVETLENRRKVSPFSWIEDDIQSISSHDSAAQMSSDTPVSSDDKNAGKGRWIDVLKSQDPGGELLSHTPAAAAPSSGVTRTNSEASSNNRESPRMLLSESGSVPALSPNPEPTSTQVLSANAELAKPFPSTAVSKDSSTNHDADEQDPVKSLLDQLTEVHDSLQREKTVKWNEFLRKVRAERRRTTETGDRRARQIADTPEAMLADGEIIGISGLATKGKVGKAKWNEFRALVLRGIPVTYRSKIWSECSGAASMRIPGYYDDLVRRGLDDLSVKQQIQMDITRTLTDNIFFRKGTGVRKLEEILLAYARRNPDVGYCQGMNLITAHLLLIMPTAEDAFWILSSMVENILPAKYYDSSLLTSRADQQVLRQYVAELLPILSRHLDSLGIELEALTFQWFLSVFTDCLSAEALFRVWDVVLCMQDGSTFLFQVALALLKLNEKQLLACEGPGEVYAYINQHMTDHAISIDGLIKASEALKKMVRGEDVRARRQDAVQREEEAIRVREAITKGITDTQPAAKKPASSNNEVYQAEDARRTDETRELAVQEPQPIADGDTTEPSI